MTRLERAHWVASAPSPHTPAMAAVAESAQAATDAYNQGAWAILYGALVNGLGVSPETFQMSYPYAVWNWETQSTGYISAAQYDALSTIPAWSAIGKYVSTGQRFNDQYRAFLDVISPDTDDPQLRQRLEDLFNQLTETTNAFDRTRQQARQDYAEDTSPDKVGFTEWLGTLDGKGWQTKLQALEKAMAQAQANYDAAVAEANTPNLAAAKDAYNNQSYWAQLNDSGLKDMPKVPNWTTATSSQKWKDRAATGSVPSGSITLSQADSKFDFSKTWAQGSASVGDWFWSVKVGGQWSRIDSFESDDKLTATVEFDGIEEVTVQPSSWYAGVTALAKGPFKRGYSGDGADGSQAVFGEQGFLPMVKTGMYVVYRPSFTIKVDRSTFSSFAETFKAATAIRVGPFTFSAGGGSEKSGWTASESDLTFKGKTDSTDPFILGYTVRALP